MEVFSMFRQHGKREEGGFTLVEILVVILIIGVLTAIAIPMFLNQRKAANEAALRSDMHTIQLAMENCAIKQTAYPDIWVNWGGKTIKPACVDNITVSNTTRTHSFDLGSYYPATGLKAGDAFCIEIANDGAGMTFYYRSDKRDYSTQVCQNQ